MGQLPFIKGRSGQVCSDRIQYRSWLPKGSKFCMKASEVIACLENHDFHFSLEWGSNGVCQCPRVLVVLGGVRPGQWICSTRQRQPARNVGLIFKCSCSKCIGGLTIGVKMVEPKTAKLTQFSRWRQIWRPKLFFCVSTNSKFVMWGMS